MRTKLIGIIAIVAALSGVVAGAMVYTHAIPGVTVGSSYRFMDISAWQSRTSELTYSVRLTISNATSIQCWVPSGSQCGWWHVSSKGAYLNETTYTQAFTVKPVPSQIQIEVDSDVYNSTGYRIGYATVNEGCRCHCFATQPG